MEEILYAKYSNDRAREYQIKTEILLSDEKSLNVRKSALFVDGEKHIASIEKKYIELSSIYKDVENVEINKCRLKDNILYIDYIEGETLEDKLDKCIEENKKEEFDNLIAYFQKVVEKQSTKRKFAKTSKFINVFGDIEIDENYESADYCDIDIIFANVICNDRWNIVDYEWTFDFSIPIKFILFRSLYYFFHENEKRKRFGEAQYYEKYGITENDKSLFAQMEMNFQKYIMSDSRPLYEIRDMIGKKLINIGDLLAQNQTQELEENIQIYFDYGQGFSEENSVMLYQKRQQNEKIDVNIEVPENVEKIRIDPATQPCILTNLLLKSASSFKWNMTDGIKISDKTIVFNSSDPQFVYDVTSQNNRLQLSFEILLIPESMKVEFAKEAENYIKLQYNNRDLVSLQEQHLKLIQNLCDTRDELGEQKNSLETYNLKLKEKNLMLENANTELEKKICDAENEKNQMFRQRDITFGQLAQAEQRVQELTEENERIKRELEMIKNSKVWRLYRKIKPE